MAALPARRVFFLLGEIAFVIAAISYFGLLGDQVAYRFPLALGFGGLALLLMTGAWLRGNDPQ